MSNTKKIQSAIDDPNKIAVLEEISEDPSLCTFGKTFKKISENKQNDNMFKCTDY